MSNYYRYNREHKPIPSPVTIGIVAITALVTLAQFFDPSNQIDSLLSLKVYGQWQGEWWRIMSYSLVHGGWMHVGMNLYMLWMLGVLFEKVAGKKEFLVVYLASVLGGGIAILLFGKVMVPTVGASGGVYGVMGALLGFIYSRTGSVRGIMEMPFGRSLMIIAAINIAISFVPGISLLGHVGGLIPGLLLGYLIERHQSKRLSGNEKIGALALVVMLIGGAYYGSAPIHRRGYHILQAANSMGLELATYSSDTHTYGYWRGIAKRDITRADVQNARNEFSHQAKSFDSTKFWQGQVGNLELWLKRFEATLKKYESISAETITTRFPDQTPEEAAKPKKSSPSIVDRLKE